MTSSLPTLPETPPPSPPQFSQQSPQPPETDSDVSQSRSCLRYTQAYAHSVVGLPPETSAKTSEVRFNETSSPPLQQLPSPQVLQCTRGQRPEPQPISVASIRKQCADALVAISPAHRSYFLQLEHALFERCGQPSHECHTSFYYRKYIQLRYNLEKEHERLIQQFSPSHLVFLSSDQLSLKFKEEQENIKEQQRCYAKMLESTGDEEDVDPNLVCPYCRLPGQISVVVVQTRRADEGGTAKFFCNKCKKGWQRS